MTAFVLHGVARCGRPNSRLVCELFVATVMGACYDQAAGVSISFDARYGG